MELFIDSAELSSIKEYFSLSIFTGITTTPTFFFRNNIMDYENEIKKILQIEKAEVHIEALGNTVEEIVENSKKNHGMGENIVSKIPISKNGIRSIQILKKLGIKTNMHLIFSVNQAIMAGKAGADYICPLLGRMHDIGINAFGVLEDITRVIKTYNLGAKVMASSIRSPDDVQKAAIIGVDAVTIPPPILEKMFYHPLTGIAIEKFNQDVLYSRQVNQLMKTKNYLPLADMDSSLYDTLAIMTQKKIGLVIVINKQNELMGIVTDGDMRRILNSNKDNLNKSIKEIMNKNPVVIHDTMFLAQALEIMEEKRITTLVVINEKNIPIGYLNLHDILPHHASIE
ncbi:MAG: CBS domain-containing protein [Spirochaetales bacterium]|nr:CBS domain-containing protein [Spirochaetales bacterium]